MSRKFITTKELDYIAEINRELIQEYVGQTVIYYAISEEHTVSHRLYHESVHKTWFSPVEINALVAWDNPGVDTTQFTLDSKYGLDVYFHTRELVERNVKPREGDFVEFGQVVFEITSVTQPQLVFGQVNEKIMTQCRCEPSREGQMQVHGDSAQFIDNTHPVEPAMCKD